MKSDDGGRTENFWRNTGRTYVEIVEIPGHPFFIGCQFHPEFKSKPLEPHPLFKSFAGAAYAHGQKRKGNREAADVEMFLRPAKVARG